MAVSVASEPLHFPNGSAITPDGATLIVSESFGNRLSAFDIAADGTLGPITLLIGDLPEVEVPRVVQLYAPVVTKDNVDQYLTTAFES